MPRWSGDVVGMSMSVWITSSLSLLLLKYLLCTLFYPLTHFTFGRLDVKNMDELYMGTEGKSGR
jgi:hypothetical protein